MKGIPSTATTLLSSNGLRRCKSTGVRRGHAFRLGDPDLTEVEREARNLTSPADVLLQTFGFGGGTNAQGTVIGPGGTFVARLLPAGVTCH
jgi:hypothetical protein